MTYALLVATVALAAFGFAAVAASVALWWAVPRLAPSISGCAPARRARWLLLARCAPAAAGLLALIVVGSGFALHESRATRESPPAMLVMLALCGIVLTGAGGVRGIRRAWETSRWLGSFASAGSLCRPHGAAFDVVPVDGNAPVLAVVGVLRPRVIASADVLSRCSPDELDVMLRHEAAHCRRRDNLAAGLFDVLPDMVRWSAHGRAVEAAWREAAEEAADDEATSGRPAERPLLAGALVRVARMAGRSAPAHVSAFFHPGGLEQRVRRLVSVRPAPVEPSIRARWPAMFGLILGGTLAAACVAAVFNGTVHAVAEHAVKRLP